jgi:hypothetical protein
MLNQIRKSQNFKNDLERYQTILNQLPEGADKQEFSKLVSNLIQEVKKLDEVHVELIFNKQMPSVGTERRESIVSLRRQLETKIKEFRLY